MLVPIFNTNCAIIDENQAIIVETLKTANLMKNPKFARAISDAGWYGFIVKLEYKAVAAGVHLVKLGKHRRLRREAVTAFV